MAANVLRLTSIIVVSEVFDAAAGRFMHESSWISLLPYVPALLGTLILGHWLREKDVISPAVTTATGISTLPQKL